MSRTTRTRTLAGAWFQVAFAGLLVALLIAGIAIGAGSFTTGVIISYVCGVVAVGTYLPRAIGNLVTLRREQRRQ